MKQIWTTKPETASRVRGRMEAVLSYWAATQKLARENPAKWEGNLEHLLPAKGKVRKVRHHPALAVADLPTFMVELRNKDSVSARALEYVILTAARTSEVTGMRWSEIDGNVWTCPGERTKSGREHRVPLCERAVAILSETPRVSELVFPLSNMAMLQLLRGMRPGLTVHGFRSTFRDWAGDHTVFPREVIETALAHTLKDKTEAAYRRADALEKRTLLMEQWARFCDTTDTGTVVHMARTA